MVKALIQSFEKAISDKKTDNNKLWFKRFAYYGLLGFFGFHRFQQENVKGGLILLVAFILFMGSQLLDIPMGLKVVIFSFWGYHMFTDGSKLIRGKTQKYSKFIEHSLPTEIIIMFLVLMLVYLELLYLLVLSVF